MMPTRRLGRTDMTPSVISLGAWAIGGSWGAVDDELSMKTLHAAIDAGVNFIDTADVYGMGRSERLIARLLRERPHDRIWVATKAGRKLPAQTLAGYSPANLAGWVEQSLTNLGVDAIDLLQLHCPHPAVYDSAEVFGILDDLVNAGKIRYYGVSVETVDEARRALVHPHVQSIQIIFNQFRVKPAAAIFELAQRHGVGILARVPLASGVLTGKFSRSSTFAADDHRHFNRHGEEFDQGETFSGVPFDVGLQAVEALRPLVPGGATRAQFALRWILMWEPVTCAIPGARTPEQARANATAAALPPLDDSRMAAVHEVYETYIREHVHARW
jgi:aryl-alcohol dehydrogenase-like predicted oxidoreductase